MGTVNRPMAEADKADIANRIISELKEYKAECPHGITAETALGLKEFVKTYNTSKKTIVTAFTWTIVIGTFGLIVAGIVAKIRGWVS